MYLFWRFFTVSMMLSITACVTVDYQPPVAQAPAATVQGTSQRQGLAAWQNTAIESIDNKSVGLSWSNTAKSRLFPGNHTLVVKTNFNNGFFSGGPYLAINEVTAEFKPYQNYKVKAKLHGNHMQAWVENSEGKRVSNINSVTYQLAPVTYVTTSHFYIAHH